MVIPTKIEPQGMATREHAKHQFGKAKSIFSFIKVENSHL